MVLGLPLFNFGRYRDPICCSFLPSLVGSGSRDKGSSLPRFDQGVEVGLVEEKLPQFTPPWKGHAYTFDRSRSLEVPNGPRRNAEVGSGSGGNTARISKSPVWCRLTPGIAHSFSKRRGRSVWTARPSWPGSEHDQQQFTPSQCHSI